MPKIAANLTMLFNEVPFLERFGEAAKAGFKAVEFLLPYDYRPEELAERLHRHGLKQVLFNMPPGDWKAGERGIGCHPNRVGEFQDGVGRAIEYAKALGCPQVNGLAGIAPPGVAPDKLMATFVENLRFAARETKKHGVRLVTEPINTMDIPGFYLTRTAQAVEVIKAVGSDNLFIQYDVYHMQIMEGDLARTIERNLGFIKHIQIADNPGRHEPGTGEINYPFLFRRLDELGYGGHVSCEYKPAGNTAASLGWAKGYL